MARRTGKKREFEELSSYSSSKEYRKHRRRGRVRKVILAVGVAIFLLLGIVGAVLIHISTTYVSKLSTTSITKDPEALGINTMAGTLVQDDSIKNIALFGLDSRTDVFEGLSDVTMILTVDNRHDKVKLTSIMRDSEVHIEGQSYSGYVDWYSKINASYMLGGPQLAIRTLNQNFGLDITDYVTLNFAKLAALIDAFGGVDLEVTGEEVVQINQNLFDLMREVEEQTELDEENGDNSVHEYADIDWGDFVYRDDGEISFYDNIYADGVYHLTGDQAVAYGRIRRIGDDFERVQRQQKVLRKMMEKIADISVVEYPNILRQLMPLCETSLELDDVLGMAPIVTVGFTVETISVPDYQYELDLHDSATYNLVYDVEQASHRINCFIYEDISPYWDEYGYDTGVSAAE